MSYYYHIWVLFSISGSSTSKPLLGTHMSIVIYSIFSHYCIFFTAEDKFHLLRLNLTRKHMICLNYSKIFHFSRESQSSKFHSKQFLRDIDTLLDSKPIIFLPYKLAWRYIYFIWVQFPADMCIMIVFYPKPFHFGIKYT